VTADPGETPARTADGTIVADLTATPKDAAAEVPPELLAQSLGQYLRAWWLQVRSGNSGVLPVVLGMVVVAVIFEIVTPEHAFLRPSNLVYIFGLSTVYMVLAMAETVVLLLGEIDLSVGAVALFGGVIAFKLVQQPGPGRVIYDLVQGLIAPTASWVALAVVVAAAGAALWLRAAARRRQGLVAPPVSLTIIRIALVALVGVAVVLICTINRGTPLVTVQGVPWVIPIVLVVLGVLTLLLQRTRFGRYVYAIGGNPEAARRAGVSLAAIRTWAFALCSATAGLGGILLGSFFFGQYSTNTADPGQLVLYSVAAAVIGGVSLFGGRGKPVHGVLGGLLIGAIAYGVSLLSLGQLATPLQYIVPGGVLIVAVLVDVLSRRGTGSVARA